jgi:xanthine dehydrogenase YagR molybdenum-binding subunit
MANSDAYDPAVSAKLGAVAIVGKPLDRLDGLPKVTGRAKCAYEYQTSPRAAYGFIVEATIARGRILSLDTDAAQRAPGVQLVMTYLNAPKQAPFGPPAVVNRSARARPVLADAEIRYFGEPIALVVADSFEQARAAANLVQARYDQQPASFVLQENLNHAYRPERVGPGFAADTELGDFEGALDAAPVKIDAIYDNAYQNHNPLEPHAAIAQWDGDTLTAYVSQQSLAAARTALAATLRIAPENVNLIAGRAASRGDYRARRHLPALFAIFVRRLFCRSAG